MLKVTQLAGFGSPIPIEQDPYAGMNLYEILTDLGLTGSLWTVLDAGEASSHPGSGSTWSDLSGNGNDATISGAAFNGTADGHSADEYLSFDGNDYLQFTNDAFINGMHKDNAGPATFLMIYLGPNSGGTQVFFSTDNGTDGWQFRRLAAETMNMRAGDAGGVVLSRTSSLTFSGNTWGLSGVVYDEAASDGYFYIEGAEEAISGSYSGPPTTGPDGNMRWGQALDGSNTVDNGTRLAGIMIWETDLTPAQMDSINAALAMRFGWA